MDQLMRLAAVEAVTTATMTEKGSNISNGRIQVPTPNPLQQEVPNVEYLNAELSDDGRAVRVTLRAVGEKPPILPFTSFALSRRAAGVLAEDLDTVRKQCTPNSVPPE